MYTVCANLLARQSQRQLILLLSDIFVDNIHMELSLWDTAGQEEFDRLRSLSYDDTQAIMLCFSVCSVPNHTALRRRAHSFQQVDNPDSLENVGAKWTAEIAEHCPGVKIVLVALKCDLREEQEKDDDEADGTQPRHIVTYQEGLAVARRIGALRYLGTFAYSLLKTGYVRGTSQLMSAW